MEDLENKNTQENFMLIDQEIKDYLLESARWGKFLAIVGYIGIGFLIIIGLIFMAGFSFASRFSGARFPIVMVGFFYAILAILYFFLVNYLFRFSDQIKKGFESNRQQTLASGFSNMKSMFKFLGILTIVILSIYALILLIAIPASILLRHNLPY